MNQYKVIAFDLDGTLVDSAPDIYRCATLASEELNVTLPTMEQVREWIGNGLEVLGQRILSGSKEVAADLSLSKAEEMKQALIKHYQNNVCVDTYLYSGVRETLTDLRNKGFKLAVITNKTRGLTLPVLSHLDIEHFFEFVVGGDDVVVKKPDPEGLLMTSNHFSISPQQILMVGDSKNDILAAQNIGCDVVAVDGGYNQGENLQEYTPTYFFAEFSELTELLSTHSVDA